MKFPHVKALYPLLLAAIIAPGCAPATESKSNPQADSTPSAASESAAAKSEAPQSGSNVKVELKSWDDTIALVKNHTGKVVVVDVWATYCPPCVEEFPHLVKLQKEHADKVVAISVSAEYDGSHGTTAETHQAKVLAFLQKQNAEFQNVLLTDSTEDLFGQKFTHQSIPIVMVYDQTGAIVAEFPNPQDPDEFTYEQDVLPVVYKLIGQTPSP